GLAGESSQRGSRGLGGVQDQLFVHAGTVTPAAYIYVPWRDRDPSVVDESVPVVGTEPPVCGVTVTVGGGAVAVAVATPAVTTVPATTALTISRAAGEAVTSSSARPMFRYSSRLSRETTSQPSP